MAEIPTESFTESHGGANESADVEAEEVAVEEETPTTRASFRKFQFQFLLQRRVDRL